MKKTVLDESKFKSKLLVSYLSSPMVLLPFLVGITDLLALWTFSIDSGMGIFAGIAGILGGLGFFLTKLLAGDEKATGKVLEKLEKEALEEWEKSLDDLDRKLAADGDPRTETCLRDLRTLAQAFQTKKEWTFSLNSRSTFDILSGVERLFSQCIRYLEKSLDLWYTSQKMTTEDARKPLLVQREKIIEDVGISIRQLGSILADIQGLGTEDSTTDSELTRIREELDRSLDVARTVNKRMKSLDREIGMEE